MPHPLLALMLRKKWNVFCFHQCAPYVLVQFAPRVVAEKGWTMCGTVGQAIAFNGRDRGTSAH